MKRKRRTKRPVHSPAKTIELAEKAMVARNEDNLAVSMTNCFYCLKPFQIVMNTKLTKAEAMKVRGLHGLVLDRTPCPECTKWMNEGIILIGIVPEKCDDNWWVPPVDPEDRERWLPNPYRSGHWLVVKDCFIEETIEDEDMVKGILRSRFAFMDEEVCKKFVEAQEQSED